MEMLKEMAIFAAVVQHGGFSAAARQLGLTTSAVSRHVTRLEAYMGGRLLQRTTRSLSLTELGTEVHAGCVRLLNTAREIHAFAGSYRAQPSGLIKVSAPIVFGQVWLAPKLPGFLARHPEVDIRLTLVDRKVDLIEEGMDVAIRISNELAPGLAARPLCGMRYVLVATPAYLQRHAPPGEPAQLADHSCIYLGYSDFGEHWPLQRGSEQVTVKVRSRMTINNSAAILAAVEADGGIGLMPDFTAKAALETGRVVQVLPDWSLREPYAGAVHAVYVPGRHVALKIRAFIDYLLA
ncbi:LysR family transcriptional regulator [Massilia endophytica]|uniref:LysR family transcriptional regulator n=1 Tax=Massilia endophytica TaxID=2899220 RepID=UPI001E54173A|nr:LysR family transcriptional regulator [Massilia endophytica]UGQ44889.1 LysR family transcriptional regulator [Massilia endophytica]